MCVLPGASQADVMSREGLSTAALEAIAIGAHDSTHVGFQWRGVAKNGLRRSAYLRSL